MRKIIVGSRESVLAVVQANMLIDSLKAAHPELEIELVTMKTTGDKILDRTLDKVGGKGLFVKELDAALLERRADITVHSLKDMPMEVSAELPLLCFSKREDPRDALVLPEGATELAPGAVIGSSSLRRALQLKAIFPDHEIAPIRGNLQTRLRKLDEGGYGALVLAAAGLKRMGLADRIGRYLEPDEVIPSAAQGVLAVQGRTDADSSLFDGFADSEVAVAVSAERAFVTRLDGGCSSPIAAHARLLEGGNRIELLGLYYDEEGQKAYRSHIEGAAVDAVELAYKLADDLRAGNGDLVE